MYLFRSESLDCEIGMNETREESARVVSDSPVGYSGRSGPETVLEQCTGEAGLTLVEVLRAIKQAKVAGADLGVFFHLLDSLLPPALLQEAVDCMERGAVTAYCCSDSTAAFHVVRPGQEDLSVFAAKGGRTLTGDSEPSSAIGNRDNAGACRSRGYLVLPRHCSCKAFQCNVLAQESDLTVSRFGHTIGQFHVVIAQARHQPYERGQMRLNSFIVSQGCPRFANRGFVGTRFPEGVNLIPEMLLVFDFVASEAS